MRELPLNIIAKDSVGWTKEKMKWVVALAVGLTPEIHSSRPGYDFCVFYCRTIMIKKVDC